MELEQQLRKALNLGANDDVLGAVTQLNTDNTTNAEYKTKYEALVQANQERETAEANALVQKAIDGKFIKAEQKDTYLALFKADHANAKSVVEGLIGTTAPAAAANQQLTDFVGGLGNERKKPVAVEKNYEWYEENDPEALLEMKVKNHEKFMDLFEKSLNNK